MTHSHQRMRRHESLSSVHSVNTHITTPGQLGQAPQMAGTQSRGPKGPPGGHSNAHTGSPLSHSTCCNKKVQDRSQTPTVLSGQPLINALLPGKEGKRRGSRRGYSGPWWPSLWRINPCLICEEARVISVSQLCAQSKMEGFSAPSRGFHGHSNSHLPLA